MSRGGTNRRIKKNALETQILEELLGKQFNFKRLSNAALPNLAQFKRSRKRRGSSNISLSHMKLVHKSSL